MANESDVRGEVGARLSAALGSMSRRRFLQALIAAGASVALPGSPADADAEAIDSAWQRALEKPWCFEVNEWGTIVEADVREPRIWADLYGVSDVRPRDPEHLIRELENIYPLQMELQQRAESRCEELEVRLRQLGAGSSRHARVEQLLEDLSDPERGWAEWIRQEGKAGMDGIWDVVQAWLTQPVDWDQSDYFPADWHGTGRAYEFFRQLDPEVLAALGVVIVEGDHPGSDYIAAELRSEIDEANVAAANLGLPFRFRPEGVRS
jgi:hypothetical protein